jgi:hypothetical protein
VTNVVLIYVVPTLSLLNHNDIRITYARTSNFKMEPVRYVPLYFVAMPQFIITVVETPFVSAPIHNIVSIRSKPQTPRGTQLVSVHEEMPIKVNKFFVSQPSDVRGGGSNPLGPLGPLGYFRLQMVNPNKPRLPLSKPYHWPLNLSM